MGSAGRQLDRSPPRPRKGELPHKFQPQLAALVAEVPAGDDWLHEIKYDGYRLLARVDRGDARLVTRNGLDWSARFPAIQAALAGLGIEGAWLDGEIVAFSANGSSNFSALQQQLSDGQDGELIYLLFDLPWLNGQSLVRRPLHARKELLAQLLSDPGLPSSLRYSDHMRGNGPDFFRQACGLHLEGIISKRRDGFYRPGRSSDWLKSKCVLRQEFVIGGYTASSAARRAFGALLLGLFEAGRFRYVGRVGTGFSVRISDMLYRKLRALEVAECPFVQCPPTARSETVRWVRPELVAEVRYSNWTADGVLRHASFQGLREDKPAASVGREPLPQVDTRTAERQSRSRQNVFGGVKFSSPNKILYPAQGLTKLDLAAYYEAVAEWALPHLASRPLTLLRCPDGHRRDCFFQKHVSGELPDGLESVSIDGGSSGKSYPVVRSLRGLLALVQMGTLELHAWGARIDRLDRPDQITFDLDPGPRVPWRSTVQAARLLHTLLDGLGLEGFPKATGGKGLHIVVPIERRHSWDEVKGFAKAVAQQLVRFDPDTFSAKLSKAGRENKIFIDYLRNGRGATAIVPYSIRAREGAPVAVPIRWSDLDAGVRADGFGAGTRDAILAHVADDPWKNFAKSARRITAAMWAALAQRG